MSVSPHSSEPSDEAGSARRIGRLTLTPRIVLIGATIAACTIIIGAGVLIAAAGNSGRSDADLAASTPRPSPVFTSEPSPTSEPARPVRAVVAVPRFTLPAIDPAWLERTAAATGIPQRALAAYTGAALQLSQDIPQCRLDWATLAAIGFVESEHGTINGGLIGASGTTRPSIIGIALDGATTDAIGDTDAGRLDGDMEWDRAVGPMQLIPETWFTYAADGNGDGEADPQQIDDAAYTAGRYLCAVGGDLSDSAQWIEAISAYNRGAQYNNRIAQATETYAAQSAP